MGKIVPFNLGFFTSIGSTAFNASGIASALIFTAQRTGTIVAVGYAASAVTTPPVYVAAIETISARLPTGTLAGTGASGTFTPVANAYTWVSLGTPLAVTQGSYYAATLRYSSGTIDGTHTASIVTSGSGAINSVTQHGANNNGASWTETAAVPSISVKYDDGSIQRYTGPSSSLTSLNASGERGNVFVSPFSGTIGGFQGVVGFTGTLTMAACLYDATDTVIASVSRSNAIGANNSVAVAFDAPVAVTAGQTYRLVYTTGNGYFSFQQSYPGTAERDIVTGGACYYTTRATAGSGAWTDTTTITHGIVPIYDTVSAGGGGISAARLVNAV